MSVAPRFHRGRSSVTPLSVLVKAKRLSTNRFDRYGDAWSATWNASHTFSVASGVRS